MATAQKKANSKKTILKAAAQATTEEGGGMSKASFIRSLPPNTPASEVVAKAKAAGITGLSPAYVYVIRSNDKKDGKAPSTGAAPRVGRPPKALAAATSYGGEGPEKALRKAIAELGLARAREVFAEVERSFAG